MPAVMLAGIGIGSDRRLLAPVDTAQIRLCDISAQPDMVEVGERDHRRARRDHFSQLSLAHRDYAGGRRMQNRIIQVHSRQTKVRIGLVQVGARDLYIFLAAALDSLVITLLRGLEDRLGALQRGCRLIAVLRGDLILAEELARAIVVQLLLAAALDSLVITLLRGLEDRLGALQRGCRLIAPRRSSR